MPRPPETFATRRLHARKPRPDDAAAVFAAYASDPAATRFLVWPAYTQVEPLRDFLASRAAAWDIGSGHYVYLLCLKGSDTPIGSIGVDVTGWTAIFGYVLSPREWGNGYMSEALAALVAWAMEQPEIWRAWAFCDVENSASVRVMEKAGMQREGVLRRWHVCPTIGPSPRDCFAYSKVK